MVVTCTDCLPYESQASLVQIHSMSITLATDRQFPPEVVQLIVDASLASYDPFSPPRRTDSAPRYKILKSYCRLNSIWRGVSEPLLFKWIVIASEWHFQKYLQLVEKRGGAMDEVEDLFLSLAGHADSSIVARVIRSSRKVVNLSLQYVKVDLADLATLPELSRLKFFCVKFAESPSSTPIVLPHLRYLTIASVGPSLSQFVTPSCLPQLLYFDFSNPLDANFDALLPQLHATTLSSIAGPSFSLATSLRLLLLPQNGFAHSLDHHSRLTVLPPFLSIDYESQGAEASQREIKSVLQNLINRKRVGLRIVLLRDWEIDVDIKELVGRLERTGIRVEMRKAELSFSRAVERMEEILSEEAREANPREV